MHIRRASGNLLFTVGLIVRYAFGDVTTGDVKEWMNEFKYRGWYL